MLFQEQFSTSLVADFKKPKSWLVSPEVFTDLDQQMDAMKFRKRVTDLLEYECDCCGRLDTCRVIKQRSLQLSKLPDVTNILAALPEADVVEGLLRGNFCAHCWKLFLKNQFPPLAKVNGMEIPPADPAVDRLNSFELLLIAPYRICQRIVRLPRGGQFAATGLTIALPNDRVQLVNCLPDTKLVVFEDGCQKRTGEWLVQ